MDTYVFWCCFFPISLYFFLRRTSFILRSLFFTLFLHLLYFLVLFFFSFSSLGSYLFMCQSVFLLSSLNFCAVNLHLNPCRILQIQVTFFFFLGFLWKFYTLMQCSSSAILSVLYNTICKILVIRPFKCLSVSHMFGGWLPMRFLRVLEIKEFLKEFLYVKIDLWDPRGQVRLRLPFAFSKVSTLRQLSP